MESISLLIGLVVLILSIWLPVRILHHAGYSGWWVLLLLVPVVNLVMIWVFAYSDWPALSASQKFE